MTTITLPISKENFVTNFPEIPPKNLHFVGRFILWIRESTNSGIIRKVVVYTIALFISLALITSIVFSPLFIYGFREYIQQSESALYDEKYKELLEIAKEQSWHNFLKGRLDPLNNLSSSIRLPESTRKQMMYYLKLKEEAGRKIEDTELIKMIAIKDPNFLNPNKYGLHIQIKTSLHTFLSSLYA